MKAATLRWFSRPHSDALYLTGWAVFLFAVATVTLDTHGLSDLWWVYLYLLGPMALTKKTLVALAALKPSSDPTREITDYLLLMAFAVPTFTGLLPLFVMRRLLE